MDKVKEISDIRHIRIFMDQKRQHILQVLRGKQEPMTSKQIADALGLNPATIHFHTNKLLSIGVLKIVRTEVIHGITAKYLEPAAVNFKLIAQANDQTTIKLLKKQLSTDTEIIFDRAKQDFTSACASPGTVIKRLSYTDMYLTFDELSAFNALLDAQICAHSTKKHPDQLRYRVLISCIADDENVSLLPDCC